MPASRAPRRHRSRVPDAVRHSSCRSAEPGPYQAQAFVTAPALQRTAPQVLRAALRPGHEFATLVNFLKINNIHAAAPSLGALSFLGTVYAYERFSRFGCRWPGLNQSRIFSRASAVSACLWRALPTTLFICSTPMAL